MTPHRPCLLALRLAAMTLSAGSAESRVFGRFKLVEPAETSYYLQVGAYIQRRAIGRARHRGDQQPDGWLPGRDPQSYYKLPHLDARTQARRRLASEYDRLLIGIPEVETPKIGPERDHVYHLYVIRTESRDALQAHLAEAD